MIVSYFGFKVFTLRVFFFWANIYLPSIKFMRKNVTFHKHSLKL